MLVFYLLLSAIFLLEGLGLRGGREMAYNVILVFPFVLFAIDWVGNQKILVPRAMGLVLLTLFLVSLASTFFSVDIQRSFEYLLFGLSAFLLFIYAYTHQNQLRGLFLPFITLISIIFLLYSLFLTLFGTQFPSLIPHRGYQFVFPFYQTQHPVGSFLVAVCVLGLSLYVLTKRKPYLVLFLLFFLAVLFSYSRSVYVAIAVAAIILYLLFAQKGTKRIGFFLIIAVTGFLFFGTVREARGKPIIGSVHSLLTQRLGLNNKSFLSSRNEYIRTAFVGIQTKPFFGSGPNTFFYISKRFSPYYAPVETSHNLFLDVFSEEGVFAGILAAFVIGMILRNAWKRKDSLNFYEKALFVVWVAVLVLFQADAAQRLYSYFLLFVIIGGLFYREKQEIKLNTGFVTVVSFLLVAMVQQMILSNMSYTKQDYRRALDLYPLNTTAFEPFIKEEQRRGNYASVINLMDRYAKLRPADPLVYHFIGDIYSSYGQNKEAQKYYEREDALTR